MTSSTTRAARPPQGAADGRGRPGAGRGRHRGRGGLSQLLRRTGRLGPAAGDPRQQRPEQGPPPPSATASTDPSKVNYERFPERSKDEKIVGREERPIDQRDLTQDLYRFEILANPSVATPRQPNASGIPVNAIGRQKQFAPFDLAQQ